MGIVYYLAREDSHTLYEIGKLPQWRRVFETYGAGFFEIHVPAVVGALVAACEGMWCEPGSFDAEYLEYVARDVQRWSEGRPFVWLSEHADRLEDSDSLYREAPDPYEWSPLRITGERYR